VERARLLEALCERSMRLAGRDLGCYQALFSRASSVFFGGRAMRWIKFVFAALLLFGILEVSYRFLGLNDLVHVVLATIVFLYSSTIFLLMRNGWVASSLSPDVAALSWPGLIALAVWVLAFRTVMLLASLAYAIQVANMIGQPILTGESFQPFSSIALMIIGYIFSAFAEIWAANYPALPIASLNLTSWQGNFTRTLIYVATSFLVAAVVRDWIMLVITGKEEDLARRIEIVLRHFYLSSKF
jgi:hypothetical protein